MMRRRFNRLLFFAATVLVSLACLGQSIPEIRDELLRMREVDQQGREAIHQIEEQHGPDSVESRAAWERQNAIDAANMQRLEEIILEVGWPRRSVVGSDAAMGAFLILQHADLETQKEYLLVFRKAVDAGEATASSYALLYDRVLMREGERQVYGSQLRRNEATGEWFLWPIEAEEQVDDRRAALGMSPLEDYLGGFPFEISPAPKEVIDGLSDE